MNINFLRAVDRFVGVPICAFLSLIDRIAMKRPHVGKPSRILVILLSEMGSLVLAQPMFARIKQEYPDVSIHVMLFAKNREVLDLLDVVAAENVVTLDDRSLGRFVFDSLRAIFRIRALDVDAVIDCELFSRVSSIFSYLSGAELHVGFHRHSQEGLYRGSFINRPVLYNPYRHLTLQFLTMVAALESKTFPLGKDVSVPVPEAPPPLVFAEGELAGMAARLHADFDAVSDKRLILVYPSGGLLPIRAWPFESYVALCTGLLAEGFAIGVIGLKDDRALAQALLAGCSSSSNSMCIDLTGYTKSVRDLLALFHRAALLITNDGGPGQFAALTSVPSIVFFGPETPQLYRPLSANAYCFHAPMSCSPCLTAYNHRASPCDGDNRCLKQIAPEQVLAKALEMLTLPSNLHV
jgi:ADP-heptose:LPS heptosyltransferase